uniref:Geminivirus AL1 replication-associated protein catalytic domain-containing protein n=1 Tax=Spongospora subterranea TaxID=70186 RepID=A0A0H5QYU1_9EUKA|eukprot:CRZ00739.1 hypothetical protein [Spongospora subterranea]
MASQASTEDRSAPNRLTTDCVDDESSGDVEDFEDAANYQQVVALGDTDTEDLAAFKSDKINRKRKRPKQTGTKYIPAEVSPADRVILKSITKEPQKGFAFRGTRLFATWPKCDTLPASVIDKTWRQFPHDIERAVVKQEAQKDGTWHLHALIIFRPRHRQSLKSAEKLDALAGKRGRYLTASSQHHVLKYLLKDCSTGLLAYDGANGESPHEWLACLANKFNPHAVRTADLIASGAQKTEIGHELSGCLLKDPAKWPSITTTKTLRQSSPHPTTRQSSPCSIGFNSTISLLVSPCEIPILPSTSHGSRYISTLGHRPTWGRRSFSTASDGSSAFTICQR